VPAVPVTIFSDFTCPYCYVTEAALWRAGSSGSATLRFRAYELYPAPLPATSPADEPGWREAIAPFAEELALSISAPAFRPRTAKAHEAACFAAARGRELKLRRSIFAAYWGEGADIGRIDVLTSLAAEVGLDGEALKIALDIDLHHDDLVRHRDTAARLRIPGAPTIFVGEGALARVLIGAHSPAALDEALAGR
jgi:predicted DsbA family dithiol-disulfide isomerase